MCYAGVLVISTHGDVFALHFTDSLGVVLALGSTVLWALYWIFNTSEAGDPIVRLFLNFALSLPFVGLYCAWESSLWPVPIEGLVGAGGVGLFEMGVAFCAVATGTALRRKYGSGRKPYFCFPVHLAGIYLPVGGPGDSSLDARRARAGCCRSRPTTDAVLCAAYFESLMGPKCGPHCSAIWRPWASKLSSSSTVSGW